MRKIILIILFTTVCLSLNAQDYKIYTYNKNDTINLNDILYFKKDTIDVIYLAFIDDRLLTKIKQEFKLNPYIINPYDNKWVCLKNKERGSVYYEFYENYGLKILKIW